MPSYTFVIGLGSSARFTAKTQPRATQQDHHDVNIIVTLEVMQAIPMLSPLSDFMTSECELPGYRHDAPQTRLPLRAFDKFILPSFLWLHLEAVLWFIYAERLWGVDSHILRTILVLLSLALFVLPLFFRGWISSISRLKLAVTGALLHQILLLAAAVPLFIRELIFHIRYWELTRFLCCVTALFVAASMGVLRLLRWHYFVDDGPERRLSSRENAKSTLR